MIGQGSDKVKETAQTGEMSIPLENENIERYQLLHPLVYSMLKGESVRTKQLETAGSKQIFYPKGNSGWWSSLFIWEGRALKSICGVWSAVVLHAVLYCCIFHWWTDASSSIGKQRIQTWDIIFGIALNAVLGLLMTFRLNRAATRFWLARQFWGVIVARIRSLVSGLLVHGHHDPQNRDEAIRWTAAFCLSVMEFLRGCSDFDLDLFSGILSKEEVALLARQGHPPLFAGEQVHYYMKRIFCIQADTVPALSTSWSHQLATLENEWSLMMQQCGGMERIKSTPLPIVYISHERTFLLITLLLYPYIWGHEWGWSTIPIVALVSFSLLGIEAASVEVEQPFHKNHVNSLNMAGFCIGVIANIQQMIRQQADRELAYEQTMP